MGCSIRSNGRGRVSVRVLDVRCCVLMLMLMFLLVLIGSYVESSDSSMPVPVLSGGRGAKSRGQVKVRGGV